MKRNSSWLLIASALLSGCGDKENEPPNIVIFHVDDLGWTDVGCFGSDFYETPSIDKLCENGIKFTNAYAPGAVCSPSRSSIMTGKYPAKLGITNWIWADFQKKPGVEYDNPNAFRENPGKNLKTPITVSKLPLSEKTIAEYLKDLGYTTFHIGKWHLGGEGYLPTDQGFDINIAGCDYGEPPFYFDPYYRLPGFWYNEDTVKGFPTMEPRKEGEFLTDRLADETSKFIQDHKGVPFFVIHNFYAVHIPLQAPDSIVEKYKRKKKGTHHDNPVYAAMIERVDRAVKQITGVLDSLGLTENTMVIFTSDNGGYGGATNNYPLRAAKGTPYEGGIRVPFIIRWPEVIKEHKVIHEPITTMDIVPTLAELLDFPLQEGVDGVSVLPLIYGQSQKLDRDYLYWHFPHYRGSPYSIIRGDSMKLIRKYDPEGLELYNLNNDVSEEHNLAEEYPGITKKMNEQLDVWLQEMNAKMPVKKQEVSK